MKKKWFHVNMSAGYRAGKNSEHWVLPHRIFWHEWCKPYRSGVMVGRIIRRLS